MPSDDVSPSDGFPAVVRVALSGGQRAAMFFLAKYLYELDLHCRVVGLGEDDEAGRVARRTGVSLVQQADEGLLAR